MNPGYDALRGGAAILDLSTRGRILVRGRDRARLLHNLTSNEVKKMAPGSACYAFLLSPQGRIQADLYLLCFDEHFLIDTEPELREKVLQHIRRYIIADQVEVEDLTSALSCVAVEGPSSAGILLQVGAPAPEAYIHKQWGVRTVAGINSTGQLGYRVYLPSADAASLEAELERAGAVRSNHEDARVVRIEKGKPRYGEDISDRSLPQETQQMHAVSFTKGCYLGQEIVERIRAQGHVNKKLVGLKIEGAEPLVAGTKLFQEDVEAGQITSTAVSPSSGTVVALAYVRTQYADSGTRLVAGERTAWVQS